MKRDLRPGALTLSAVNTPPDTLRLPAPPALRAHACVLGTLLCSLWAGAATPMLQLAGWPADAKEVVWERLPLLESTRVTIFQGRENVSGFSHHPAIAWHGGRFFAAWSNGDRDEDASGQRVLYSTSQDGHAWTPSRLLAPGVAGRAYTPGGFWLRDGEVLALAAFRKSRDGAVESDDNPLLAYRWDASALTFALHGPVAPNFFANDAPRLTPDGRWLMLGKPGERTTAALSHRLARGGVRAPDDWSYAALPEPDVSHDSFWYKRDDGSLVLIEAGGRVPNRRLIRMHSTDAGNTWDPPIRTNFPDADSRLHGLRLSNGRFVLLNNPNPHRYRVPLSLAVSPDGVTFPALANVRIEQINKRFSGYAKAPGYQYVRAVEHNGFLWVIYSVNKEDIELSVIPLAALEGLLATPPAYPVTGYGPERVLDNLDREFASEGPWTTGTTAPGFYGSDYAFQRPPAGQAAHGWAGWDARVEAAGTYHAYLRWATIGFSQRSEMTDIVPVEIVHGGQVERTSVDQTRYGGAWIFLGAYRLAAGDRFQVKVHATGRAVTVADALKLVPVPAAAWFPPRAP